MAKTTSKASERGSARPGPPRDTEVIEGPTFTRKNLILLAVALAVIVLGFVTLSRGDVTLAPILLVVGYLVLVPLALLKR